MKATPDGGWGWMVVLATFMSCFLSAGSGYAFGVLYVAFLGAFGKSKAEIAWIAGINSIVSVVTSSYGVALSKRFGHRKIVMVGGVLASAGVCTSAFTTQLHQVYITFGVITDTESAYLPAVMGLAQIIGRPLFGTLGNLKKLTPNVPFSLALFLVGISMIVSNYTRTLAGQLVFVAIMGACVGGSVVCVAIVVKYFLGSEKLGHALSLLVHLLGICTLLFAPFGGWIRDVSNTYDGTFWMAGVAVLLSSALALVLPLVDRLVKRKNQNKSRKRSLNSMNNQSLPEGLP